MDGTLSNLTSGWLPCTGQTGWVLKPLPTKPSCDLNDSMTLEMDHTPLFPQAGPPAPTAASQPICRALRGADRQTDRQRALHTSPP